jgi:hypothetical protein
VTESCVYKIEGRSPLARICWPRPVSASVIWTAMELNDPRWASLKGGYGVPFDPRPALLKLADGSDSQAAWDQLWDGLHHQGDVGEASYACVPHLVRIHEARGMPDWNTYAIVATIDLARERRRNPTVPAWLDAEYASAIEDLAGLALKELPRAVDRETTRSMLAVLAIWKGARMYGRVLVELSEDELSELGGGLDDDSAGAR